MMRSLAHLAIAVVPLALVASACSAPNGDGTGDESVSSSGEALTTKCGAHSNGPVQGVDVSQYQGSFDFAAAHVQFAYTRISDGTGTIDPTFGTNWAHMKSAGILRGAYQFFRPGEDEVAQANLVIQKVGGKLQPGDLPVMLDMEATDGVSMVTLGAKALHWLKLVEAGTGRKPFVYTYSSFLSANIGLGGYTLWVADYGATCPLMPVGWSDWGFWQYSDGAGHLDHDVFNGTLAQLKMLAGETAPADAGAPPASDAGEAPAATPAPPTDGDAGAAPAPTDDGVAPPAGDAGGGCSVAPAKRAHDPTAPIALVALGLGLALVVKRSRRRSS